MRYWGGLSFALQASTVLLLSLVAVFAISDSFVFPYLLNLADRLDATALSAILGGLLFVAGTFLVVVNREPRNGTFAVLVTLPCIPTILAQSTIDWPAILRVNFDMPTGLTFEATLGLALLLVVGYLVLELTAAFNRAALAAGDRRFDAKDVDAVYGRQHAWGSAVLASAVAIAVVVVSVAYLIAAPLGQGISVQWGIVLPLAILSCLVLIAVVYAFTSQHRVPAPFAGNDQVDRTSQPTQYARLGKETGLAAEHGAGSAKRDDRITDHLDSGG